MLVSRLFLSVMLGLMSTVAFGAEPDTSGDRGFVLSAEPEPVRPGRENFINAEILPVPGNGTVFALRAKDTGDALYRFSLEAVRVTALLGTLSQTLYDENDTAAIISHGERLTVWDDSAGERYIDITVDELSLAQTLDLVSLESGCNIYVSNRTIVVDACGY